MARFGNFKDPFVKLAGLDLSTDTTELTYTVSRRELDYKAFGDDHARTNPGIKEHQLSIKAFQDFAASKLHRTVYPLWHSGSVFSFVWRPKNAAASATNPEFSGSVWVKNYPLGGPHGENLMTTIEFGIDTEFTESTS